MLHVFLTPYHASLPASARYWLKIFVAILFFNSNNGFCLTINVYDVSQAPPEALSETITRALLKSPLIQQIHIKLLNQKGQFGDNRSLASYSIRSSRPAENSGSFVERPEEAGIYYLKTLKRSSRQNSDDGAKKKKQTKKSKKLKEPVCTSVGRNPLASILGNAKPAAIELIIENPFSGNRFYDLEVIDSNGKFIFHPEKPDEGLDPVEFFSTMQKLEQTYGRHHWHKLTDIQEDLSGYEHQWSQNLVDLLLGLHCLFSVKALVIGHRYQRHLGIVLGYEIMLPPQADGTGGQHLFLQIQSDVAATIPLTQHNGVNPVHIAGDDNDASDYEEDINNFQKNPPQPLGHYVSAGPCEDTDDYMDMDFNQETDDDQYTEDIEACRRELEELGFYKRKGIPVHIPRRCKGGHNSSPPNRQFPPDDFGDGKASGFSMP